MDIERLRTLVEGAINAGDLEQQEWEEAGFRLTVLPLDEHSGTGADHHHAELSQAFMLSSTMLGLLYLYPEPGAPAFVAVGDTVRVGQQVGLIEAMKTFCPVLAERAGRVVAVLAEHGAEIGFGQPLFRLE